jgi:hypothetical protein
MALPPQFRAVRVSFKGVRAEIPLAATQVFFGPNDAGKTNLLEGFLAAFALDAVARRDPVDPGSRDFSRLVIEFADKATPNSLDQREFLELVAFGQPGHFLAARPDGSTAPTPQTASWRGERADVALVLNPDTMFSVGTPGHEPRSYDAVMALLRDHLLDHLHGFATNWDAISAACEVYVDRALTSTTFQVGWFGIEWLMPMPDGANYPVEQALTEPDAWNVEDFGEVGLLGEHQHILIAGYEEITPAALTVCAPAEASDDLPTFAATVDEYLERRAALLLGNTSDDPWFEIEDEDDEASAVRVRGEVRDVCRALSAEASALAPRFVVATKDIEVTPMPLERHHAFPHRIRLGMRDRDTGRFYDLATVGSGIRIWAVSALLVAMQREPAETDRFPYRASPPRPPARTLYLFDEPERHLHPTAQDEAAQWVASLAVENTAVVIATHSLAFLNIGVDANYWLVQRDADGATQVRLANDVLTSELDAQAGQLGITRIQALQLTRRVLVVEGLHDELVIRHLYGPELNKHRVLLIPLFGANQAAAIADLELLQRLDRPLFILFDNTRREVLEGLLQRRGVRTSDLRPEERQLAVLLVLWQENRAWPTLLPFDVPDIICGLPESAVRRAVRSRTGQNFTGWDQLRAAHAGAQGRTNFKDYFSATTGLAVQALITDVIQDTPAGSRGEPILSDALESLFG